MTEIVDLSWRFYPAGLMIAGGLALVGWSVGCAAARARRERRDPVRALGMLSGFRGAVVGLAAAGIGAAWWWHAGWLLGLSLIIGGEELLESSVAIAALHHAARPERVARRRAIVYTGAPPPPPPHLDTRFRGYDGLDARALPPQRRYVLRTTADA
jgi:hypothetical protein